MELELEVAAGGGGGSRVVSLSCDVPVAELGRGDLKHGGLSKDRTVSIRHVSLRLLDGGGDPAVAFEVVGKNPVVVRRSSNGGDGSGSSSCSRVFRGGEKGELRPGDALSLSLKAPLFWVVRRKVGDGDVDVEASVLDAVARRERRTRERKERERLAAEEAMAVTKEEEEEGKESSEVEGLEIDLASIDPAKEFGFLSMGHEFDSYPKGRIRPPKDWNWFLEEIKRNSDDEEDEISNSGGRPKGGGRNKKKKDGEGEDEDWTDEGEDEKQSLSRGPSVKRTKYVTRSKDLNKPRKEKSKVKIGNDRDGDGDFEEDETLGGFIVNEEDEAMDEMSEEEEEEEFDDEDDDD